MRREAPADKITAANIWYACQAQSKKRIPRFARNDNSLPVYRSAKPCRSGWCRARISARSLLSLLPRAGRGAIFCVGGVVGCGGEGPGWRGGAEGIFFVGCA